MLVRRKSREREPLCAVVSRRRRVIGKIDTRACDPMWVLLLGYSPYNVLHRAGVCRTAVVLPAGASGGEDPPLAFPQIHLHIIRSTIWDEFLRYVTVARSLVSETDLVADWSVRSPVRKVPGRLVHWLIGSLAHHALQ